MQLDQLLGNGDQVLVAIAAELDEDVVCGDSRVRLRAAWTDADNPSWFN